MKAPAATTDDIKALSDAIAALDLKVSKLTIGLAGDDQLQTKGLIHEVQDAKMSLSETRAVVFKTADRVKTIESLIAGQADLIDELKLIRIVTNRFWKLAALFVMGGFLNPFVTWLFHGLFAAFK